ncbi:MAG TPA: RcnB family protein [Allosphingosinicella sp.]
MSRLWLIGLAASAAWTPAAMANGAPPAPPPPPMAHGAHAPMAAPGATVMHGGVHRMNPPRMHGGGHVNGMKGHMKGWQRFGRGHVVPHHFRGRQFFVHNWQTFGWPTPMPGSNWIRYYDDALLIDRDGRVIDGRYGWDWDRRDGRHGDYDEDRYEDDYDYAESDYDGDHHRGGDHDGGEWAEERREGGHHGGRIVRVHPRDGAMSGDCRRSCTRVRHMPPPPPPPAYGHGYGYGYGYGAGCACGPVVITETTTTTAPVMETRTYYETVYDHRAAPRRHYKKPVVRHYSKPARRSVKAAPAPRPGERG